MSRSNFTQPEPLSNSGCDRELFRRSDQFNHPAQVERKNSLHWIDPSIDVELLIVCVVTDLMMLYSHIIEIPLGQTAESKSRDQRSIN